MSRPGVSGPRYPWARPRRVRPAHWDNAAGLRDEGGLTLAVTHLFTLGWLATTIMGAAHPRARASQRFVLVAAGYLVLLCVLGGLLTAAFRWNLLHVDLLRVHAVTALIDCATILAMGAAYRLPPMFALSHGHGEGAGGVVLPLAAAGTPLVLVGLLMSWPQRRWERRGCCTSRP